MKSSESDILEFLFKKGLPQDTDMNLVEIDKTDRNLKVVINGSLDWETVDVLLKNIDFHAELIYTKFHNSIVLNSYTC